MLNSTNQWSEAQERRVMQQHDKGLCQLTSTKMFQHRLKKNVIWHLHVQPVYSLQAGFILLYIFVTFPADSDLKRSGIGY
jgi:hypothetical protein